VSQSLLANINTMALLISSGLLKDQISGSAMSGSTPDLLLQHPTGRKPKWLKPLRLCAETLSAMSALKFYRRKLIMPKIKCELEITHQQLDEIRSTIEKFAPKAEAQAISINKQNTLCSWCDGVRPMLNHSYCSSCGRDLR